MKRILSCLLALVMLITVLPPIPAEAITEMPGTEGVTFSGDSAFGRLLSNVSTPESASTEGSGLESLISTLEIQGTTATVTLTAPTDAKLVVGVYDETEDTLLGAGTLDVTAGEDPQTVTLTIEIDSMPQNYRGKAFLVDPQTFAPISTPCQYEKATSGYQAVADAKVTDFPEELAVNLDEDITTNFVVFREDAVRLTPEQIRENEDGSFTLTNAPELQVGDVFFTSDEAGNLIFGKVSAVGQDGGEIQVESDPEPGDIFEMIKVDVDSTEYGLQKASEAGVTPTAAESAQVHLLGEGPLNKQSWDVEEDELKFNISDNLPSITIPITVTVQYYFSHTWYYSYFSGLVDYTVQFSFEKDLLDKNLLENLKPWESKVYIPTQIPVIGLQLKAVLKLELEAGAAYHIDVKGSFGKELYVGAMDFHDIGTPPALSNGLEASAGACFSFSAGLGVSITKLEALSFTVYGKLYIEAEAGWERSSDISEKIHVCNGCIAIEITGGFSVEGELTVAAVFDWNGEIPIVKKEICKAHWCPEHDTADYPYDTGKELIHHGFTECSRDAWKVTLVAEDSRHNPLRSTQVTLERRDHLVNPKIYAPGLTDMSFRYLTQEDLVTDNNGNLVVYLENGHYAFIAGGRSVAFEVKGEPTQVTLSGGVEDEPEAGEISLEIAVPERLVAGETVLMSATLYTATGPILVTEDVDWSTENVFTVTLDGCAITADKVGTATIEASVTYFGTTYKAQAEVSVYEVIAYGNQGSMTWEYGSDHVLKISGTGAMPGNPWRAYNPTVERIIIEEGITTVSASAFEECVMLKSVSLPVSVETINSRAFALCESLESLFLPKNVKSFASDAVVGCKNLKSITVDPENPHLNIVDGLILTADGRQVLTAADWTMLTVRIPDGVMSIHNSALAGHPMTRLQLPDNLQYVGMYAFEGCASLTTIQVYEPESDVVGYYTRQFAPYAFRNCTSLTQISFPSLIPSLQNGVFQGCSSLVSVTIPEHITWVGHDCFRDCTSLEEAVFPDTVTNKSYFGGGIFWNCNALSKINLPNGIDSVTSNMFERCWALTDLVIPEGVKEIGYRAFLNSAITNVTLPSTLKTLRQEAFENTPYLLQLDLPVGLEMIEAYCFAGSGLTSLVIPDTVTYSVIHGLGWFVECPNLEWVVLGSGMTQVPGMAFSKCENLIGVFIRGKLTEKVDWSCFSDCTSFGTIYYAHSESEWPGVKELDPIFDDTFDNVQIVFNYDINPRRIDLDDMEEPEETEPVETEPQETEPQETEPQETEPQETEPVETEPQETEPVQTEPQETEGTETEETETGETPSGETGTEESGTGADICLAAGENWGVRLLGTDDGQITREDGGVITAGYTGLNPGRDYLILMLLDQEAGLTAENLIYIDQKTAASDGTLSFRFTPRVTGTDAQPQLIAGAPVGFAVTGVEDAEAYDAFYIDGKLIADLSVGIAHSGGRMLTGYRFASNDTVPGTPEQFSQYPIAMDVWELTFLEEAGCYQARKLESMHNILQYNGCSIRITGEKGIRMLTSIPTGAREALMGEGLEGYTLEEYGTALCWEWEFEQTGSLTIADAHARSNFAYSREKGADAIFAHITDSATGAPRVQYTNVLVKFTNDQCTQALCMRPYMILRDENGELVTIYGGIVIRSIGYIALQNANVFAEGTPAYQYVHDIINYCYPTV